jgi:sugar phosphate isomerase/epimerase
MRLGAPIFLDSDDPDELAREHRRLGYGAAYCPTVALADAARVRATREAFARADVVIAEVGAWRNMMDPDPVARQSNLVYVTERLALAEEVGALCCVDIAGSFSPSSWYGPHPNDLSEEAFDLTVENVRRILDEVKPKQARFGLEMMPAAVPNSADDYLRLLAAVDRPMFAIHLDPVNLINSPDRYFGNGALLRECFAKLGPRVVSCHAKDTLLSDRLTFCVEEARPGLGTLDYRTYLSELARLPAGVPLMVEHLKSAEEYGLAVAHIRAVAAECGLAFGGGQG